MSRLRNIILTMSSYSVKEIENRLNAIARLRLIFNSTRELNDFTGFNSGPNNSFARIGGDNAFIKNAVYDSLCNHIRSDTDIDFDEFLTEYKTASAFYEKKNLKWLARRRNTPCYELLKYVYAGLPKTSFSDSVLAELVDEIYVPDIGKQKINVLILILLALKLLPLYTKGRGDVEDICSDFEKFFSFLSPMMNDGTMFTSIPAYDLWQERGSCKNRFSLYRAFAEIMENYMSCTDRKAFYLSNQDIHNKLEFPLNDKIWIDDKSRLWRFERLCNGYFALVYEKDQRFQIIRWARYEMVFHTLDDEMYMFLVAPQGGVMLMKGKELTDSDNDYFRVTVSCGKGQRVLHFTPVSAKSWFDLRTLTETDMSGEGFVEAHKSYRFIDRYPDSTYKSISQIAAVTVAHVYIPDGEGRYYKVPKSEFPVLQSASVNDIGGLFELPATKERFIGFIEYGIYINVSNSLLCEQYGIQRVCSIIAE